MTLIFFSLLFLMAIFSGILPLQLVGEKFVEAGQCVGQQSSTFNTIKEATVQLSASFASYLQWVGYQTGYVLQTIDNIFNSSIDIATELTGKFIIEVPIPQISGTVSEAFEYPTKVGDFEAWAMLMEDPKFMYVISQTVEPLLKESLKLPGYRWQLVESFARQVVGLVLGQCNLFTV